MIKIEKIFMDKIKINTSHYFIIMF